MSPLLIAALSAIVAAGHDVCDVLRADISGQITQIRVAWVGDGGVMAAYDQGFNGDEDELAYELLRALLEHSATELDDSERCCDLPDMAPTSPDLTVRRPRGPRGPIEYLGPYS